MKRKRKKIRKTKNLKEREFLQKKVDKLPIKACKEMDECKYASTCPKCKHRICNANSLCCKACTEGSICPMRGTK